jgi:hypothetical protein
MASKTPKSVWLKHKTDEYWEGTHMHVQKETATQYIGMCSIGPCSFRARFDKVDCTTENPMELIYKTYKQGDV